MQAGASPPRNLAGIEGVWSVPGDLFILGPFKASLDEARVRSGGGRTWKTTEQGVSAGWMLAGGRTQVGVDV